MALDHQDSRLTSPHEEAFDPVESVDSLDEHVEDYRVPTDTFVTLPDETELSGYRQTFPSWAKKRSVKIGAPIVATLLTAGVALGLSGNGMEEETETNLRGNGATEVISNPPDSEVLADDDSPLFMTASDPSILLNEYQHNEMCMLNSRDVAQQQECAAFISDPTFAPDQYQALLNTIEGHNQSSPKEFSPGYHLTKKYTLIDSEVSEHFATLVAHVETMEVWPEAERISRSEAYVRLHFFKANIIIEDLTADGEAIEVWFKSSEQTVEPGTVRN